MAMRNRAAFTLVEMLVVITIMGVLMSLLLAGVQSAREAARRAQCTSNQRQLGLAVISYDGAKKHLPGLLNAVADSNGNATLLSWAAVLLPYIGKMDTWEGITNANGAVSVAGWRAGNPLLNSGLPLPGRTRISILTCPDDLDATNTNPLLSYAANMGTYVVPPRPGWAFDLTSSYAQGTMTKPIMMTTPGVFQDYFYSNLNQVVGTPYKTPTNAMIQLSDVKYPQTTVMLSERKNDGTSPREWDVDLPNADPTTPARAELSLGFSWPDATATVGGSNASLAASTFVGIAGNVSGIYVPPPLLPFNTNQQPVTSPPNLASHIYPLTHPGIVIMTFCDGHVDAVPGETPCSTYYAVPSLN